MNNERGTGSVEAGSGSSSEGAPVFWFKTDIPLPRKHDLEYVTTSHALMEHHTALTLPWNADPLIHQVD